MWFRDENKLAEKRVLFDILLDCEENWTENDIGNAGPLLEGILKKFTMQDLLRFRDDQRKKIASELAKSLSSRSRRTGFSSLGSHAISDSGRDVEENGAWNNDEGSGEDDRCWSRVGDVGGDSDVDSDGYVNSGDDNGDDDDDEERGYDSNCSYDHREDDYGDDNGDGDDDEGEMITVAVTITEMMMVIVMVVTLEGTMIVMTDTVTEIVMNMMMVIVTKVMVIRMTDLLVVLDVKVVETVTVDTIMLTVTPTISPGSTNLLTNMILTRLMAMMNPTIVIPSDQPLF